MRVSSVQPFFAILVFYLLYCLFRYWRSQNRARLRHLLASCIFLFLYSWPPVAWLLLQPLERRFPVRNYPDGDGQAIVVLASGAYFPSIPALPAPRVGSDTYERCQYAAWLFKHWKQIPLLVSGGPSSRDPGAPAYAILMRDALRNEGVPDSEIWQESSSQSTHENAQYSATVLAAKHIHRIILVTDAYHMLRAEKSFEKAGLQVVPAACGFRSIHRVFVDTVLPGWEAIAFNEDSLHEYFGLFWYWVRGWV